MQGVSGDFCSPKCSSGSCPSDVPDGVTAKPTCALRTPTGENVVRGSPSSPAAVAGCRARRFATRSRRLGRGIATAGPGDRGCSAGDATKTTAGADIRELFFLGVQRQFIEELLGGDRTSVASQWAVLMSEAGCEAEFVEAFVAQGLEAIASDAALSFYGLSQCSDGGEGFSCVEYDTDD